jgi:hypothetical protein
MKLGQEGGAAAAGNNPHIISLSRPAANPDFSGIVSAVAPQKARAFAERKPTIGQNAITLQRHPVPRIDTPWAAALEWGTT